MTAFSKKNFPLGGFDQFVVRHPGLLMEGEIRTDLAINFSSLFKNTYTIITYHHLDSHSGNFMQEMAKMWADEHNGEDRIKHITAVLFPHAKNHWDMWYRMIETTFVPGPAASSIPK